MESKNGITLVDESCVIERKYVGESTMEMNEEMSIMLRFPQKWNI